MSRSEQIKKDKIRIGFGRDSLDLGKRLETLRPQRKIVKKKSQEKKVPFLPQTHGKTSRRSLARASPRGRKARTFGKIPESRVQFWGSAKKVLLPGLGPAPPNDGAESSTLWARKSPFLKWLTKLSRPGGKRPRSGLAEAAEEGQETGQGLEQGARFPTHPR